MSQRARRAPRIAVGCAGLALVVAGFTGGWTWHTERCRASGAAPAGRHVPASAVLRLRPGAVVQVDGGVRVTDEATRRSLGLGPGDTITAISGRPAAWVRDLSPILRELAVYRPRSLFVELVRDREPVVVRWELDGDLDLARRAELAAGPADPRIATVKQLAATTFEVPRATVEAWTADPELVTTGGRGVPVAEPGGRGIRLYAIRPGSVYAALGLENGDLVRAINGREIAGGSHILEQLAGSTQISVDLLRQGQPMILNYLIK